MLDHMAEVDDLRFARIRHSATPPISIQMTLSTADGSAPCHQPLTMKPAAPPTFIAWYAADWPVSRPIASSK